MKTSTFHAGNNRKGLGGDGVPGLDFSSILRNIPTLAQVRPMEEKQQLTGKSVAPASRHARIKRSRLKSLAEAIILQSIEDLWSKTHKNESIEFFTGEGFRHCADMADMSVVDRLRIIRMLRKVNAEAFTPRHTQKLARMAKSL
jgi:hypothetical protein